MTVLTRYFALLIMTTLLSACIFFNNNSSKLYKRAIKKAPYDAGIVPGVPWVESGWDTAMKGRVIWAVHLYKRGLVKNLIFSGGAVYTPYYEGKIMCLYAQQLGVPAEHCFAEIKAEHSVENVYFGKKIADSLGFTSVALLTDPFQAALLKRLLKKYKPHIARIPFIVDTLPLINKSNPIISGVSARNPNFTVSLAERETKWQRLQGTRGKKVKKWLREDRRLRRSAKSK
ncbi:MAG TPA: YdcF family protein [Bacteroidia bacterium]|nr:YdcF family protein [Bacteroidia bacterium]HRH09548.1 YdcF family protein [Bacteroidia bacterium]